MPELVLDGVSDFASDFVAAGASGRAPVVAGAAVGAVCARAYEAPNVTAKSAADAAAVRKRTVVSIDQLRQNGTRHSNQVSGAAKDRQVPIEHGYFMPDHKVMANVRRNPDAIPLAVALRKSGSLATLRPVGLPENHAKT